MFERALIRRIDGTDVDLGLIAETIFFYNKTQLLLDRSLLIGLTRALSLSDFQRLVESGTVQLSYRTGNFGVISSGSPRHHKFVEFFVGSDKKRKLSVPGEIELFLTRELKDAPDAAALRRLIIRNVKSHKSPRDQVPKLTDTDVRDKAFLASGIRVILRHLVPEYSLPADFEFSLHDTGEGLLS
jgi:hypothetical protein